jgi:glutathione S-transferase
MKLYGDVISPFVRMALVTAHEVGLGSKVERAEARVVPTEVNAELVKVAPLGKIPVLVTDHGHALYDSRVIIEYLCHIAGNSTLIPDDGVKRFRVLTLAALGQGIADSAVAYRYETGVRPKELAWPGWLQRTRERLSAAFDDLEVNWVPQLADNTAGSIAVAVALAYIDFRLPDLKWHAGRSRLAEFQETFSKRDSMVKTKLG